MIVVEFVKCLQNYMTFLVGLNVIEINVCEGFKEDLQFRSRLVEELFVLIKSQSLNRFVVL